MPKDQDEALSALSGIRVIELGSNVSAAYGAKLMADLGADIIKVESLDGDISRKRGPFPPGAEFDTERSGIYLYLNTNKRGVTLNLDHPRGRDILEDLIQDADVLVHNIHPAASRMAGITYDELALSNDRLIVCQISAFGSYGPHANIPSADIISIASGGWAFISPNGLPDSSLPPVKPFGQQAGFQAGVYAAISVMGALFAREATGYGQSVEVSEQECIAAALSKAVPYYSYEDKVASRIGAWNVSSMELVECRDGLVLIMIVEEHQWDQFMEMLGRPEWADWEVFANIDARRENADVLRRFIADAFRDWSVDEVFEAASERRLPFAPVSTVGDVLKSEHLKTRGFFAMTGHPAAAELVYPGAPYKLAATPWRITRPAPLLGQHNKEVYGEIGLSDGELTELHEEGII